MKRLPPLIITTTLTQTHTTHTDELLDEPPHRRSEPLVPPTVVKHIIGQALLQLSILAAILGPWGSDLAGGDGEVQRTLLFNTFVWLQLFNQVRVCGRECV